MSNLLRSLKVTGNDADAFGDTIPPAPPVLCSLLTLFQLMRGGRSGRKLQICTNITLYLRNDTRLGHSYYRTPIGSHRRSTEWYNFR